MRPAWIQGRPTRVDFQWPNASICNFDDWFCRWPEGLTTTVIAVACHGCSLLDDPTGTTEWSMKPRSLTAVATSDGTISVAITLRFDATGDERTVSATAQGDHEVALEADCHVIDIAELHDGDDSSDLTSPSAMHPCSATRLATEAVMVFPAVRTYRDERYFPFCYPGRACVDGWDQALRPLQQLSMTPEPAGWGQVGYSSDNALVHFAAYTGDVTGPIVLSAPLLSGAIASASLVIPGVPASEP